MTDNPYDDPEWDAFVKAAREGAVKMIDESALVMSLVPGGLEAGDKFDVKYALELGAAIMMNKPIIAVAMPGRVVPDKIRAVSDVVVECDVDTVEGQDKLAAAVEEMRERWETGRED